MRHFKCTSEAVCAGHPDKVCDILSDTLLDACLRKDKHARCAIEVLVTTNTVVISGEVSPSLLSKKRVRALVRETLREIGYEQEGFHWETVRIHNFLCSQSEDIATGVRTGGAGDQGMMVGFATDETPSLIPSAHYYAHKILGTLEDYRKTHCLSLLVDAKSQVTMEYIGDTPYRIDSVVLSSHHLPMLNEQNVRIHLLEVAKRALGEELCDEKTRFHLNPAGRFIIGGPVADTGLTGRKIMVDTYGSYVPHGGGAFSGKDPSKVDRSGAYMGRYLAKNIVAAGLAKRCLVYLAYAIGKPEPVAFRCDFQGSSEVEEGEVEQYLLKTIDLTPCGILERLDLARPIYKTTASGGHFGRDFSWEQEDLVEDLRARFRL